MNRVLSALLIFLVAAAVGTLTGLRQCSGPSSEQGQLARIDPGGVERIVITRGTESFEFKRKGKGWVLVAGDIKDAADETRVAQFLASLQDVTYSHRIPSGDISREDLELFGVRREKSTVEVIGRDPAFFILGNESAAGRSIYARLKGSPDVFIIDDTLKSLVELPPGDFRSPVLTDYAVDQIEERTIRNEFGELSHRRGGNGWEIVRPLRAPADNLMLKKYLLSLLEMPIRAFAATDGGDLSVYGIQPGQNEIDFFREGGSRRLVLRFGDQLESGRQLVQFTDRDAILEVPGVAAKLLNVRPDELRERSLLVVNSDIVDRIRLSLGGRTAVLNRFGKTWSVAGDFGEHTLSSEAVEGFLSILHQAQADQFRAARLGEGDVSCSVEFLSVLSENTPEVTKGEHPVAELHFGLPQGEDVWVEVTGQAGSLLVSRSVLAAVEEFIGSFSVRGQEEPLPPEEPVTE